MRIWPKRVRPQQRRDPAACVTAPWRWALAALAGAAVPASAQDAAPRLNVLLIVVDDVGWTDLHCYGGAHHRTFELDRLSAQGMRFNYAYAGAAVCSPTRAALLTGRHPARLGVTDWIDGESASFRTAATSGQQPTAFDSAEHHILDTPTNKAWLDLEEETLAELLRARGYVTGHVGKWHLGPIGLAGPAEQGFAHNAGGCRMGQPPSYFDPFANERFPDGIPTLPPREEGQYLVDREVDEAIAFLTAHRDEPWFLHWSSYSAHAPLQAPNALIASYRGKMKRKPAIYAAMIEALDRGVGQLLAALQRLELADRTLVIFVSDNGGAHFPRSRARLRGGKGEPYEGGLRVPMIVRWPGVVAPSSVCDAAVTSADLLPTVCAATGTPLPEDRALDGLSLLPLLRGEKALDRDVLTWHFPHYWGADRVRPFSVIRSGTEKLVRHWEDGRVELFDLARDPREENDLAGSDVERAEALDALLLAELDRLGARRPRPRGE
ncbi:MAG: sulfatase [Planctomycetota bacterium]